MFSRLRLDFARVFLTVALGLLVSCGKPPGPAAPPGGMAMPVIAARVRRQALEEKLPLVGSLQAKEDIRVVSELDGRVVKIGFESGRTVEAGAPLFELDSRRQRALRDEARARLDLAVSELKRGEAMFQSKTIPPQELERLRAAHAAADAQLAAAAADLEDTVIEAPFRGAVSEREVSVGQFVRRGEELALLLQTDPLELVFQIPERHVGQIALGQAIELNTVARPGEPFAGEVGYISPKLDEDSRTLMVKAYLPNPDGKLRAGMFGTVELAFRALDSALILPETAVLMDADRVYVVGVDAEKKAFFRPVKTGIRLAGRIEIVEGLAEGDIVVIEGYQKLGPGSPVVFAPESAEHGVEDPPPAENPAPAAGDSKS